MTDREFWTQPEMLAEWRQRCRAERELVRRIYREGSTMTTNNGTVTVTKDKIELAREGWAALGGVEPTEVQSWCRQKYSVEVSIGTILKAKPDNLKKTGGGKKDNGANGDITATELRRLKALATEGEGLTELEALLKRAQEIADAAGSLERAREVAAVLRELTS